MRTVLIIDDNPEILAILNEIVTTTDTGIKTLLAMTTFEAEQILNMVKVDVVLSDEHLGDRAKPGSHLASVVKKLQPSCQFVLMSGDSGLDRLVEVSNDIDSFIAKPFDIGVLLGVLNGFETERFAEEGSSAA